MNFQISDKVVCVDDKPGPFSHQYVYANGYVKKDEVYTVEEVVIQYGRLINGGKGHWDSLLLVGKPSFNLKSGNIVGFSTRRFRRLQDLKNEAKSTHKIAAK